MFLLFLWVLVSGLFLPLFWERQARRTNQGLASDSSGSVLFSQTHFFSGLLYECVAVLKHALYMVYLMLSAIVSLASGSQVWQALGQQFGPFRAVPGFEGRGMLMFLL